MYAYRTRLHHGITIFPEAWLSPGPGAAGGAPWRIAHQFRYDQGPALSDPGVNGSLREMPPFILNAHHDAPVVTLLNSRLHIHENTGVNSRISRCIFTYIIL